ncbi:MAG: hypothetical protein AAFY56_06005 [Pseudomonadota bacterium]
MSEAIAKIYASIGQASTTLKMLLPATILLTLNRDLVGAAADHVIAPHVSNHVTEPRIAKERGRRSHTIHVGPNTALCPSLRCEARCALDWRLVTTARSRVR